MYDRQQVVEEVASPIHIHPELGAFDNFTLAHMPDSLQQIVDFKQVCRVIILITSPLFTRFH